MFVKTTARKTKSGTVRYLHLAHSEWDPVAGRSVPKILYGFGREDPARPCCDQAAGRVAVPAARSGRRAGRHSRRRLGVEILRVPPHFVIVSPRCVTPTGDRPVVIMSRV